MGGMALLKKLRKAKKDCGPYDKPDVVKTHLRDMLIMPEMIGSVVGVHNGKVFTSVEVNADMVGHYLGEFSISYKRAARPPRYRRDLVLQVRSPQVSRAGRRGTRA